MLNNILNLLKGGNSNAVQSEPQPIKTTLSQNDFKSEENIWDTKDFIKVDNTDNDQKLKELKGFFETDGIHDVHVEELSAVPGGIIPGIIGGIVDIVDGESKDGEIGDTKQHQTGDCWLLSGINALSYTEAGREIIKNALEYHDGYTIVHLEGVGDYKVTDEDLRYVKAQIIGSHQYSTGDDDMVIFELAIEQALDDIANGEIALDPEAPWWMEGMDELDATTLGSSSTRGGWGAELMYIVTGKVGQRYSNPESMRSALRDFDRDNNQDKAMTASCHDATTVQDINGNNVKLYAPHAYAVKKVEGNIVTITNPHDSSIEIQLDMDTFINSFSGIEVTDLSKNNPKQNLISRTWKVDSEGNKTFIFFDKNLND